MMKIVYNGMDDRRGFAILTAVFIMVAFAFLAITAVSMITGSSQKMMDEYHTQQSFYLASAGLEYVKQQLNGDNDWSDETDFSKNFGPGSFSVAYTNKQQTTITVTIDGTAEGITRQIQADLTSGGVAKPWEKVAYSEGNIVGSASASGTLTGDVTTGGNVDEALLTITGDVEDNNSDAEVPGADLSYWQSAATTTVVGDHTFNSGTHNGIYYITGNVYFDNNVTVNGTIVTQGNIEIDGTDNVTIDPTGTNPAIVAWGNIYCMGSSTVNITGWLWSDNDISFQDFANVTVQGGAICDGNLEILDSTNVTLNYNADYIPSDGFTGGEAGSGIDPIGMGSWQETY